MKTIKLIVLAFLVLGAAALFFAGSFFYQNFSWDSVGDIMTVSETLGKQKLDPPKYLKETGIVILSSSYGVYDHIDARILWSLEHIKEEMGYEYVLTILRDINNFELMQSVIARLENGGVKRIIILPIFMSADDQELQVFSYMLNTKETNIGKLRLINARRIKHSKRIFLMDPVLVSLDFSPMTAEAGEKINKYVEESIGKGLEHFGVKRHKVLK